MNRRSFFSLALSALGAGALARAIKPPPVDTSLQAQFLADYKRWLDKYAYLLGPRPQHTIVDPGHSHSINDPGHSHSILDFEPLNLGTYTPLPPGSSNPNWIACDGQWVRLR